VEHSPLVVDLLILFAVSIPAALVFRRLRLPSIAGFLVVGALLGPHALGWIEARSAVEQMAEIGVALLLFTVGLEFSLPRLLLLRREILVGGAGQVSLTIGIVAVLALAAGLPWRTAVVFGCLASLSSTALVLRTLTDRREIDSPHGQLSMGILLFQDLAVIPLMLAIPLLAGQGPPGVGGILLVVGKAVFAVAAVLLLARYGFSRLAYLVVRHGGREIFTLFIVLGALGAASLTHALGLPLALGAFVAGLVISESEYSHHVVSEILPFRDVFNALFFLSVGMLLDASILAREPALVGGLVLGLVVVKGALIFFLARRLTRSGRVALLGAAALFQIGEFSFVLASQSSALGLLGETEIQRFLAVAVLTMALTPFAMQLAPALAARREGATTGTETAAGEPAKQGPTVVIAGYGLNGRNLARVLTASGIPFRVLDMNPEAVRSAGADGVPIVFGDVSRLDGLEHAGVRDAKVLVLAISDPYATKRAVALARRHAPAVQIVVRTRTMPETDELLRLGANQVIPEEFETSVEIFSRVLRLLHVPRGTISVQAELIRREGYQMLRAPVDPGRSLEVVRQILAETLVETLFVPPDSPVAGRTLGELDFRARTGTLVLSVARHGEAFQTPGHDFRLDPGDFLVVTGDHAQIERARAVLHGESIEAGPGVEVPAAPPSKVD